MTAHIGAGAWRDIFRAADYYDRRVDGLGDQFINTVEQFARSLVVLPRKYPRIPRPPAGRDIRQVKVPTFDYVLVYEVTATEVVVLSVTHSRRRNRPWRRRLP